MGMSLLTARFRLDELDGGAQAQMHGFLAQQNEENRGPHSEVCLSNIARIWCIKYRSRSVREGTCDSAKREKEGSASASVLWPTGTTNGSLFWRNLPYCRFGIRNQEEEVQMVDREDSPWSTKIISISSLAHINPTGTECETEKRNQDSVADAKRTCEPKWLTSHWPPCKTSQWLMKTLYWGWTTPSAASISKNANMEPHKAESEIIWLDYGKSACCHTKLSGCNVSSDRNMKYGSPNLLYQSTWVRNVITLCRSLVLLLGFNSRQRP